MISDFSEPGGTFAFEMFMSNEVTFQMILPDLLKRVPPGGVYLGVAPEQNFTYIAALRPKMAFIIDIRRENMIEHLMYKAMFELSPTRSEFLSRLFSRPMPVGNDSQLSIDRMFSLLSGSKADPRLLNQNLTQIKDLLQKTHGFALTPGDARTIDTIATAFYRGGPDAHLTSYGTSFRYHDGNRRAESNRNFLTTDSNYQFVSRCSRKSHRAGGRGFRSKACAYRIRAGSWREVTAPCRMEEYIASPQSVWASYCRNIASLPMNPTSTLFALVAAADLSGAMIPFTKIACCSNS
jgi:hypothetical protein